jgi:hypothetical protein
LLSAALAALQLRQQQHQTHLGVPVYNHMRRSVSVCTQLQHQINSGSGSRAAPNVYSMRTLTLGHRTNRQQAH